MSNLFATLGYYVENRRKLFENMITSHFCAKNFIDHTNSENFLFQFKKKYDEHFPNAKLANVWKVKEFGTSLLLHLTKTYNYF